MQNTRKAMVKALLSRLKFGDHQIHLDSAIPCYIINVISMKLAKVMRLNEKNMTDITR